MPEKDLGLRGKDGWKGTEDSTEALVFERTSVVE